MFCEHCGQKIPEGATFCEYCGAPVEPDANNGYSVDKKQKSSGRPGWLLPVLSLWDRQAIEIGVDAYFTRQPGLALRLENKYGYY